jgi:hypothetical protein
MSWSMPDGRDYPKTILVHGDANIGAPYQWSVDLARVVAKLPLC